MLCCLPLSEQPSLVSRSCQQCCAGPWGSVPPAIIPCTSPRASLQASCTPSAHLPRSGGEGGRGLLFPPDSSPLTLAPSRCSK